MKINKKNPKHLEALVLSGSLSFLAAVCRPFIKGKESKNKVVIFYGHTLNGNLKAFYDFLYGVDGYEAFFLVLDKEYYELLMDSSGRPEYVLNSLSLRDMYKVAKADAFITSHGLHFFRILRWLTNIKFIDVWHAVSYKGFGVHEFNQLRGNDEIWVSSQEMRKLYINRYKFRPDQVVVTGYGRTDLLLNEHLSKNEILLKYEIPKAKKYILIAPTWQQDTPGRAILPFGMDERKFFEGVDTLAEKHGAHVIFRTHLNSSEKLQTKKLRHTSFMPYSKYEVVEDFLRIADILVTDWSSIGIDFLPLKRPTIFLDVPAPFKYGYNLGPENRFGDIAKNYEDLIDKLEINLEHPDRFKKNHRKQISKTTRLAYGDTLDGKSNQRYFKRLEKVLES